MSKAILQRALSRLAHAGWGVACALSAAALCAGGALLMRPGLKCYRIHFAGFGWALRCQTVWVHVLIAVMAVWLVHAVLRFRSELARARFDRQTSSRWWVALAIAQMGLVLAAGAYVLLVVRPPAEDFVVTSEGTDIHGESYKAIRVEAGGQEHRSRRPAVAWLERRVGAASERLRMERGLWWESVTGSHQMAVVHAHVVADGAVVRHGDRRVVLKEAAAEGIGADGLRLHGVRNPETEPSSRVHHADVTIGDRRSQLPFDPEWAGPSAFLGANESPVILVRVQRNLRAPLAVAALCLLLVGAVLLWNHARRGSPSRDEAP